MVAPAARHRAQVRNKKRESSTTGQRRTEIEEDKEGKQESTKPTRRQKRNTRTKTTQREPVQCRCGRVNSKDEREFDSGTAYAPFGRAL